MSFLRLNDHPLSSSCSTLSLKLIDHHGCTAEHSITQLPLPSCHRLNLLILKGTKGASERETYRLAEKVHQDPSRSAGAAYLFVTHENLGKCGTTKNEGVRGFIADHDGELLWNSELECFQWHPTGADAQTESRHILTFCSICLGSTPCRLNRSTYQAFRPFLVTTPILCYD